MRRRSRCSIITLSQLLSKHSVLACSHPSLSSSKAPPTNTVPVQMMWCSSLWLRPTPFTTQSCLTLNDPPAVRTMMTPALKMASLTEEPGTACQEVKANSQYVLFWWVAGKESWAFRLKLGYIWLKLILMLIFEKFKTLTMQSQHPLLESVRRPLLHVTLHLFIFSFISS